MKMWTEVHRIVHFFYMQWSSIGQFSVFCDLIEHNYLELQNSAVS